MNRAKYTLTINSTPITLNLGPTGVSIENPPIGEFKPLNGNPSFFLSRCANTSVVSGARRITSIINTKHTLVWKVVVDGRHNILTYAKTLRPGDSIILASTKPTSDTSDIANDIRYNFVGKVISLPNIVPLGLTAAGEKEMYKITIEVQ